MAPSPSRSSRSSLLVYVVAACALIAGCDLGAAAGGMLTTAESSVADQTSSAGATQAGDATNDGDRIRDAAALDEVPTGDDGPAAPEAQTDDDRAAGNQSRQSLLDELEGFGEKTTGGLSGDAYVVTNLRDGGEGSLRAGAEAAGPRWIEFADGLSGTIRLGRDISVSGSKTIDGRDADITLANGGLRVAGDNVIVSHLTFVDTREDAVSFYGGRKNGWVHQSTFVGSGDPSQDGAIDIGDRSTDITVSWNRFDNWNKTSLATWEQFNGESLRGLTTKSRFTYHHNYFKSALQRQPLVRSALLHSYNNWFEDYGQRGTGVAIQACNRAEVMSENNVFDNAFDRPAIKTVVEGKACTAPASARSDGDVFTGDRNVELRDSDAVFDPASFYTYTLDAAGGELRQELERSAGS